jgi:hypothetical protein
LSIVSDLKKAGKISPRDIPAPFPEFAPLSIRCALRLILAAESYSVIFISIQHPVVLKQIRDRDNSINIDAALCPVGIEDPDR